MSAITFKGSMVDDDKTLTIERKGSDGQHFAWGYASKVVAQRYNRFEYANKPKGNKERAYYDNNEGVTYLLIRTKNGVSVTGVPPHFNGIDVGSFTAHKRKCWEMARKRHAEKFSQ